MKPGPSVLDNPGNPWCLPCLCLLRIWAMWIYFYPKISVHPMTLTSWTQSLGARDGSLNQRWHIEAGPEGAHCPRDFPWDLAQLDPCQWEWRGDSYRRQQGTAGITYGCNLKNKLMLHVSPRPVVKADLGSTGIPRGYTAAELSERPSVSSHSSTISSEHDSSLNLKEPYFLLALPPPPCPSTLSSTIPNFLHFLEFSMHSLISASSHSLSLGSPFPV